MSIGKVGNSPIVQVSICPTVNFVQSVRQCYLDGELGGHAYATRAFCRGIERSINLDEHSSVQSGLAMRASDASGG